MIIEYTGICIDSSLKEQQQYEEIKLFWDKMEEFIDCEILVGIGFNWTNDTMSYMISCLDKETNYEKILSYIESFFPCAVIKTIKIDESNWHVYYGKTENIKSMYTDIWNESSVLYETERFYHDGTCLLKIMSAK